MQVCQQCFGDSPALNAHFEAVGSPATCPTCGGEGVKILEASELSDLFAGLKVHYEPLCGNPYQLGKKGIYGIGPDIGEESLVDVLREEWEVFSDAITNEQAEEILGCVWPNYAGEYMSRPSKRWQEVQDDLDELKKLLLQSEDAHRAASEALRDLFDPWVDSLESNLTQLTWMRARIQDSKESVYSIAHMSAPPPEKARASRANPQGVPFLYVASDDATAVAEVRAEPGDWVTVATVDIPQDGSVLDLTRDVRTIDPFARTDLNEALMIRECLQNFAYELSRPIRAKDSVLEYIPTQAIALYFRDHGYAGIIFRSSLSSGGINAVFFDPERATITNPVEKAVWSKALDVVDVQEFERRGRQLRGLPY